MNYRTPAIVLTALVLGLLLVACGDDGGGAQPTAPSVAETPMDGDHAAGEAVHVTLTEWAITGEGGEQLPALHAGETVFEVHNDGETPHDFVVIATELDAGDLPVEASVVDEEAAGEVVGRTGLIGAGDIEIATLELQAGTYAIICNVAGHYEQGMHTSATVE